MEKCVVIGGGTFNKVACHLSLAAPAFGTTARQLAKLIADTPGNVLDVVLSLTKMADYNSNIVTNDDLQNYLYTVLNDRAVKVIVFNAAVCDFNMHNPSDRQRLSSSTNYDVTLAGITKKMLRVIKHVRPDIFVVGFKTTASATEETQIYLGKRLMTDNGIDLVLANDVVFKRNILLTKDTVVYGSREELLQTIASISVTNGTSL